MNWDWAIGLPLSILVEAAAKLHQDIKIVRDNNGRRKGKPLPGTIAIEVDDGKVTDIWFVC